MGILLIGIVAALFFRNEPLMESEVPTVRRERELNARLRERDVAIYLKDDAKIIQGDDEAASEELPFTLRDVLQSMDKRNKSMPSPVGKTKVAVRTDEPVASDTDSVGEFRRVKDGPDEELVPDPRSIASKAGDDKSDSLPPLFPPEDPEPSADTAITSKDKVTGFQPPEFFDEYVVRYGDTLSGIAQKTLGSQSKYQEIYEANRDRMASPDRLDVGKPIRIPRVAGAPPAIY